MSVEKACYKSVSTSRVPNKEKNTMNSVKVECCVCVLVKVGQLACLDQVYRSISFSSNLQDFESKG